MQPSTHDGRILKLALALVLAVMAAAACSVDPLAPDGKGGSGGGAAGKGGAAGTSAAGGTMGCPPDPAVACAVGRTVRECVISGPGQAIWNISCPDDPTGHGGSMFGGAGGASGAGGAAGQGGTGGGGAPCASTSGCAAGEVCTTEDGVCHAPPGCTMGVSCPAVCYGTCRPADDVGGTCMRDADCRVEADYCTGCDCRALATGQRVPACPGPGVRCLVDPCGGKTAACVNGGCIVQ
jgi:hypothetical protein